MQSYSIISPQQFSRMPWKNGLGTTVELLKKEVTGSDRFLWRVSMADVVNDGEFSIFSGYDRTLLLLEGNGITLHVSGDQEFSLSTPLDMANFRGDENTVAALHDGPIKDFNLMLDRESCHGEVQSISSDSKSSMDMLGDELIVYVMEQKLTVSSNNAPIIEIPQGSLLYISSPDSERLKFDGATCIVIRIFYHNQRHK